MIDRARRGTPASVAPGLAAAATRARGATALRQALALLAPQTGPAGARRPGRRCAVGGELDRASGLGRGGAPARPRAAAVEGYRRPEPARWNVAAPPAARAGGRAADAARQRHFAAARADAGPRRLLRGRRIIGYWPWELPVVPPELAHRAAVRARGLGAVAFLGGGARAAVPQSTYAWCRIPLAVAAADAVAPATAPISDCRRRRCGDPGRRSTWRPATSARTRWPRSPRTGQAFGDRPDRILLLRVGNPHHFPADFAALRAAGGAANIRIETGTPARATTRMR